MGALKLLNLNLAFQIIVDVALFKAAEQICFSHCFIAVKRYRGQAVVFKGKHLRGGGLAYNFRALVYCHQDRKWTGMVLEQ